MNKKRKIDYSPLAEEAIKKYLKHKENRSMLEQLILVALYEKPMGGTELKYFVSLDSDMLYSKRQIENALKGFINEDLIGNANIAKTGGVNIYCIKKSGKTERQRLIKIWMKKNAPDVKAAAFDSVLTII